MQYHTNSATFELPAPLKDKSMHMFVVRDDGPSEFSVVITQADVQREESLADFGDRLQKELGRALPRFQLRGLKECQVGGSPAIELAYSWRKDGNFMHQRQAIVLVEGPAPGTRQAMMVAATCLNAFSDEWNAAFDGLLASMTLRNPLSVAAAAPKRKVVVATQPYTFALSARRRSLRLRKPGRGLPQDRSARSGAGNLGVFRRCRQPSAAAFHGAQFLRSGAAQHRHVPARRPFRS